MPVGAMGQSLGNACKETPAKAGVSVTQVEPSHHSARFLPAPAVAITLALTCAAGVTV